MQSQYLKKAKFPDKPGVYFFMKGKDILYIGKATSLKDRARSYFGPDLIKTRGMLLVDMVASANNIKWQEADSVLEALILEASLIKKHQPYYNTKEKDDKSFNYVCITKDNKVAVVRGKLLKANSKKQKAIYGPFTSSPQLIEALKIIRKLFPYIEERRGAKGREEFYKQIKLFPADSIENKNNIKNLKLFFEGKKKKILFSLKKEMMKLAKERKFEEASEVKRKIFSLNHINDIALIKGDRLEEHANFSRFTLSAGAPTRQRNSHIPLAFRIEAYDIAHMSGKNMVGVMTVVEDGEVNKNEYRKFIIKTQSDANDTGALREILERRFMHTEWQFPDIIVMDGSTAQVNIAKKVLLKMKLKINVVGVVKDERHKPKAILGSEDIIKKFKREILLVNSEAHRFAITYHKKVRGKSFLS